MAAAVDDNQVEQLIQQLESEDENLRLKATTVLGREKASEATRRAIPFLKELFWKDSNPAVKFLAKKALVNQGADINDVQSKGGEDVVPTAQKTGMFRLIHDGDILWKVAQEEIRGHVGLLKKLIWNQSESVLDQVAQALENLGTVLAAQPLIEAFQDEMKMPHWQADQEAAMSGYQDVRQLIQLAKVRHSGINPATAAAMGNLQCPEVKESFIDMLQSRSSVLRKNAVKTLAELNDPTTVAAMLNLLTGENEELERKVIKTVSKIAAANPTVQDEVLKVLLEAFRPSQSEFKLYAIVEAVGRIGNPRTAGFVKSCLSHPLPRLRANAVEALGSFDLPDEELVAALVPMLKDPNNRVVGNAIVTLWGTKEQPQVARAIDAMAKHANKWHRAAVAYALGEINNEEAAKQLVDLLRDPDEDVRANAAKAIRKLTAPDAVARLVEFINDDNLEVRLYAIEQIGKARLEAYNDILLLILDAEKNPRVLSSTILALGRMKLADNVPSISYFLNHEDDRVRANAVEALSYINDPKVMSLLSLSLADHDSRVRANVVVALWKFGELKVTGHVRAMLENEHGEFQSSGAFALGEIAISTRKEQNLINYPLLVTALRQHPKYQRLKALLSGV